MKEVGIVGGGPAGMFLYKQIIENATFPLKITIFERKDKLGAGMPYSNAGANEEHVTNVSGNEIPVFVTPVKEWLENCSPELLQRFGITTDTFNDCKVMPRLLFGEYLSSQFDLLQKEAKESGIKTITYYNTVVSDISYASDTELATLITETGDSYLFDVVVICTGHHWPLKHEGKIPGWYDSPYPPSKLKQPVSFPVAIKGSSLTAIDAVRTLSRQNGTFVKPQDGDYQYIVNNESEGFRIVLHSIKGLLPAIRFHQDDAHLSTATALNAEAIKNIKEKHDGFVPLDHIYDEYFKQPLREKNTAFYERIKHMDLETFVEDMMGLREELDPFLLFRAECREAERSIRQHRSVYWKEMLAALSYEMNYPAKHFSAEDMLRLKKVLMPLISIVIAFVPQSSARELLALYDAGILSMVPVDADSEAIPLPEGGCQYVHMDDKGLQQKVNYKMFISAIGQPPIMLENFPFRSLAESGVVSRASLKFRFAENAYQQIESGNKDVVQFTPHDHYLNVPGININDNFQVLNKFGVANESIFIMAVPFIAGLNPDYSGLDFCATAAARIAEVIFSKLFATRKDPLCRAK